MDEKCSGTPDGKHLPITSTGTWENKEIGIRKVSEIVYCNACHLILSETIQQIIRIGANVMEQTPEDAGSQAEGTTEQPDNAAENTQAEGETQDAGTSVEVNVNEGGQSEEPSSEESTEEDEEAGSSEGE